MHSSGLENLLADLFPLVSQLHLLLHQLAVAFLDKSLPIRLCLLQLIDRHLFLSLEVLDSVCRLVSGFLGIEQPEPVIGVVPRKFGRGPLDIPQQFDLLFLP